MPAAGRHRRIRWAALLVVLVFALVFLGEGIRFALIQDVWVDESTQLTGAALPVAAMLRFLAGGGPALGVPADRMPPVSYLVDAFCLQGLGCGVLALRIVHLCLAVVGLAALVWTVARRYGLASAAMVAIIFALSPKLVGIAVELRAYPLFLSLTCAQIILLLRVLDEDGVPLRRLALFTAVSIVSIYTHFFALVATSAFFAGLAVARLRTRRSTFRLGGAYGIVLLSVVGVVPFIRGSASLSTAVENDGGIGPGRIAYYLLRLLGDSPNLLSIPAAGLFYLGAAILLAVALGAFLLRVRTDRAGAAAGSEAALWTALLVGLAVPLAAATVIHGFNPLKPTYSLWCVPLLALLASQGVARRAPRWRRWPAAAGGLLFAAGGLWTTALFMAHAEWYVHGPEARIAAVVGDDPSGTAIIYRGDEWSYAYLPLVWRYHDALRQYVQDHGGALHRLVSGRGFSRRAVPVEGIDADRLLFATIRMHRHSELRGLLNGLPMNAAVEPQPPAGYALKRSLKADGLYGLDLTIFARTNRG